MTKKRSRASGGFSLFEFEGSRDPLLPMSAFYMRMLRTTLVAFVFISTSLAIGTVGYRYFAHLPWLDAMLNASMILTGMGPVDRMETAGGKWFASMYAIFSGIAFLSSVGVFISPFAHRLIHRFHLEGDGQD